MRVSPGWHRLLCAAVLPMLFACGKTSSQSEVAPDQRPLTQLRIASVEPGKDCMADSASWPTEKRGYISHLAKRMGVPVKICPVANMAEAAKALAEKRVDFASLDPVSYAPFRSDIRPILTPRTPMNLGRTEVALVVAAASPLGKLEDVDRAKLVFAGSSAARLEGPRRTMAAAGVPKAVLDGARKTEGPIEAAAVIRAAPDTAAAYLSADWSRLCRGMSKTDKPCTDLREIWRGRPQAPFAWAVRRDIPRESWARLVGIHVALFEDEPKIARWLAPDTNEIEPTEATALDPARPGK
jgi:ABC-type phosphate/phosphonate transport system substrate-binding protein